mmetsp:Transcript_3623/g.5549  ORF Transcript_3623/g.5549 Transcript_3623/m.5549 type:complete len:88 (-) Transcript_3623:22-285(-)
MMQGCGCSIRSATNSLNTSRVSLLFDEDEGRPVALPQDEAKEFPLDTVAREIVFIAAKCNPVPSLVDVSMAMDISPNAPRVKFGLPR